MPVDVQRPQRFKQKFGNSKSLGTRFPNFLISVDVKSLQSNIDFLLFFV